MKIIEFMGFSKSGKTASIESLIKYLSKHHKVSAIKHIHIDNFSIDTEGKNTWRFSKAGADPIVSLSNDETAFITKIHLSLNSILKIIDIITQENEHIGKLDYLLVEGVWDNSHPKFVMLKKVEEFRDLLMKAKEFPNWEEILSSILGVGGALISEYNVAHKIDDLKMEMNNIVKSFALPPKIQNHLIKIPFVNFLEKPEQIEKLV